MCVHEIKITLDFWGLNGLFLGVGVRFKNCFLSTHIVEQLLFSMFPTILSYKFELFFWLFYLFWASMGFFVVLGQGSNNVFVSSHISEHFFIF